MTRLQPPAPVPSASPGIRRGSGPEIFTFDPLPEPAAFPAGRPGAPRGHRKRSRRVLYPRAVSVAGSRRPSRRVAWTPGRRPDRPCFVCPQVRRQLPAEEPNTAKRLLFLLLAVVFCQILLAEEGAPAAAAPAPEDAPRAEPLAPAPAAPEPFNLTAEPADYALDLGALLRQHPAAF